MQSMNSEKENELEGFVKKYIHPRSVCQSVIIKAIQLYTSVPLLDKNISGHISLLNMSSRDLARYKGEMCRGRIIKSRVQILTNTLVYEKLYNSFLLFIHPRRKQFIMHFSFWEWIKKTERWLYGNVSKLFRILEHRFGLWKEMNAENYNNINL